MKPTTTLKILAALSLAAIPAGADVKPVTLLRKYKKGETLRYKREIMLTSGRVMAHDIEVAKLTVRDVKPDGTSIIEADRESGKLTSGGKTNALPPQKMSVITREKSGKLVAYVDLSKSTASTDPKVWQLTSAISAPFLPDKPVKSGASWTTTLENPAVKGSQVTVPPPTSARKNTTVRIDGSSTRSPKR
jgi:hypothetical protein